MFESVTSRAESFKQPWGGLIRRKQFSVVEFNDDKNLWPDENVDPRIIGLAVDYLVRFIQGAKPENAFKISLLGASILRSEQPKEDISQELLKSLTGNNATSIISACRLSGYDVCYRKGKSFYKSVKSINPDEKTIENIQIMVERSISFWEKYGPVVKNGFEFNEDSYTLLIGCGDGDYLTKDTLWDFKVSREEPRSKNRLQLLIYYLMGKHSKIKEFDTITKIGMFNPRKNKLYVCNISDISQNIIDYVSYYVIGYGWNREDCYNYLNDEYEDCDEEYYNIMKERIDWYCEEHNLC